MANPGVVEERTPMIAVLEKCDIDPAVQLSTSAGWNQTASDWRMLMQLSPDGCFGIHGDGNLVATATLMCYDRRLGWIGMVLTHADYRRRGLARALLEHVVEHADALRIESLKLDATDQGQPLYESLGFRMEQVVERWWRRGDSEAPRPHDREQLAGPSAGMDLEAFGVDRSRLLQEGNLAQGRATDQGAGLQHRPHLDRLGHRRAEAGRVSLRESRRDSGTGARGRPQGLSSGLHGFRAALGGRALSGFALRIVERRGGNSGGVAGVLPGSSRCSPGRSGILRRAGAARARQRHLRRLGSVERTARHQLGHAELHSEPRVLLLQKHARQIPRVAAPKIRHAGQAERDRKSVV